MSLTSEQLADQLKAARESSDKEVLGESVKQAIEAIAVQPDYAAIVDAYISTPEVAENQLHKMRLADALRKRHNSEKDVRNIAALIERCKESVAELEITAYTGKALTEKPDPRVWIVEGWIPANRVTLFTGQGEVGKSRCALQLAEGLASTHRAWIPGENTLARHLFTEENYDADLMVVGDEPMTTVVASWEDEPDEIKRRLQAINHNEDFPAPDYSRIHILDLIGQGPLWQPGGDDPEASRHTSVMGGPTELAMKLRSYCERVNARLLIIDTLAAAFACNENDRALVRHFMSDLDKWAIEAQCAVLILAHPPKSKRNDDEAAYSGSTDWHGASRSMISLSKAETPGSKLERDQAPAKMNGKPAKPKAEFALRLRLDKSNYSWAGELRWIGRDLGMMVSLTPKGAAEQEKRPKPGMTANGAAPPKGAETQVKGKDDDSIYDPD